VLTAIRRDHSDQQQKSTQLNMQQNPPKSKTVIAYDEDILQERSADANKNYELS